jgi:hypothetical protein
MFCNERERKNEATWYERVCVCVCVRERERIMIIVVIVMLQMAAKMTTVMKMVRLDRVYTLYAKLSIDPYHPSFLCCSHHHFDPLYLHPRFLLLGLMLSATILGAIDSDNHIHNISVTNSDFVDIAVAISSYRQFTAQCDPFDLATLRIVVVLSVLSRKSKFFSSCSESDMLSADVINGAISICDFRESGLFDGDMPSFSIM